MRITGGIIRCGRCGKTYSRPFGHTCVTNAASRRRVTRSRFAPRLSVTCSRCGKPLGNPLTHRCVVRSDWSKRVAAARRARDAAARKQENAGRRAAERARLKTAKAKWAAAEKRRRKAAEQRRRAAEKAKREALKAKYRAAASKRAASRTHDRERHEPQTCNDRHCEKYGCRLWREATEIGRAQGHVTGFAEGWAKCYPVAYQEGIKDCPLPHGG